MICNRCGVQISNDDMFCRKCGAALVNPVSQTKDEMLWFFLSGTNNIGPMKESKIRKLIQSGEITQTTLVWTQGFETWIPAANSPLSKEFNSIVPGNPESACSEKWIWLLSTVPLTIAIVLSIVCGSFGSAESILPASIFWVMSAVFVTLDFYEVKKVNVGFSTWTRAIMIIIPIIVVVYIFVRESKTNKNYIPGVVWSTIFAMMLLFSIACFFI